MTPSLYWRWSDWPAEVGVAHVAMESSRSTAAGLSPSGGHRHHLADAAHVKQVGARADASDARLAAIPPAQ